jgi:hypothetical protein
MSTNLVITPPSGLASYVAPQGVGFEDSVLKPIYLELVQRSTRGKGNVPGLFREKNNPEATYAEMKVVFLRKARESRTMYPIGSELGAMPLCRSKDGISPIKNDDRLQPQADNCAGCLYGDRAWKDYNKTKVAPACSNALNLFFVDRDVKWPFFLQVGGMGLSSGKKLPTGVVTYPMLMSTLARDSAKYKIEHKVMPNIFDFTVTMYAAEIEGKKGTYFIPAFKNRMLLKPEDRPEFGQLYEQYVAQQSQVEAAADAGAEVDDEISEEKSSGSKPNNGNQTEDDSQQYEV